MSRTTTLALALALAACGRGSRGAADAPPAPREPAPAPVNAALEARLARLERTVGKLTAALDKQLGPVPPDPATTYAVALDPLDPIEGPAAAPVTVVAVLELMDPLSAQVAEALADVRARHPDDVRVATRYLVVHGPPAIGPGLVACSAGKRGVWPAVRAALLPALFTPGKNPTPDPHPERAALDQLRPLAAKAGLPGDALDADRAACQAWLDRAPASLAPFGVTTTPAVFVDGRLVAGPRDPATLDAAIVAARAAQAKAVAAGVPAAAYYEREIVGRGATAIRGRFDD